MFSSKGSFISFLTLVSLVFTQARHSLPPMGIPSLVAFDVSWQGLEASGVPILCFPIKEASEDKDMNAIKCKDVVNAP